MGFLLIGTQDGAARLGGFLRDGGFDLPALPDPDGSIARAFAVRAVPTAVIMDAQGEVVQTKVGTTTSAELERLVGVGN